MVGSVAAVLAVVTAAVFSASLNGLVTHPARYGWNWTLLMDTQGGYGSWPVAQMDKLVNGQPGVTAWSTFAFTQAPIDHQEVPVLGLARHLGSAQPPTTSGHPISGPLQIELGTVTLRQLGQHVGGMVTVGTGRYRRALTIVGTVTLPSMGLSQADHVSLGRGAMLPESTLLATEGLSPQLTTEEEQSGATVSDPAFPSAVAIDLASGPDAAHLAARIAAAGPGDTPGGTYAQPRVRGAAIVYAAQMGSQPLALALALALAAVLSLAIALLASVRERRRQLALLKALGLTRRQVREAIAWQATIILLVAVIVGVPLGIAAGRWAWTSFAASLGVVPVTVVPGQALLAGVHRPARGRQPADRHPGVGSRPDQGRRRAARRVATREPRVRRQAAPAPRRSVPQCRRPKTASTRRIRRSLRWSGIRRCSSHRARAPAPRARVA